MGNTLGGSEDPVTTKITERGQSYPQNIQYAASGMKGLRATMEDKHLYTNEIHVHGLAEALTDHSLFAVFDGHGGDFTSAYAAEHFLKVLSRRPEMIQYSQLAKTGSESRSDVTGVGLLRKALDGVFGDSRAVLRRGGHTLPLSFDHKPSEVSEKDRITEAGGFVKARRVDGDLAVSRALGDFVYKTNGNLPTNKQKVIANPDFVVYPRSMDDDEFIILACDGIWDVASSKQCADFVQQLLLEGESDFGVICEEALDTCLERNSKDNMTILIVGLPGMISASSAVKLQNAVWGRRAIRQAKVFNLQASQIAAQFGIVSASDGKSDSVPVSMAAAETAVFDPNAFASHLQNNIAAAAPMVAA